jgi:cobalt-zinc-cadmium efflux system outer membrane protein
MVRIGAIWRILILGLPLLLSQAGCSATRLPAPSGLQYTSAGKLAPVAPVPSPPTHSVASATDDGPIVRISFAAKALTLQDLLDLAVQNHPDLAIAQGKVQEARGLMLQAGLYPNPLVAINSDNVGDNRNHWGEPGITVTQEFVTAGKLKIARAAAAAGVQAADWEALTRWYEVVTRVRRAYTDLLAAQRLEKTAQDIAQVAKANQEAAEKLFKAGAGSRPDVLRAEAELEQARVQQTVAQRSAEAARKLLAAAVGVPALPDADLSGDLDGPVPAFGWQSSQAQVLSQSSEIHAALARVAQTQTLVQRAAVEMIPNLELQVNPTHSLPENDTRVFVNVGASLPVFNRNQGNLLAQQAKLAQAQAEVQRVELSLTERLASAFQQYQVAVGQTEAYRERILPKARESLSLIQAGYKQGDAKYNYTALLQAQQVLFQAELTYVQALRDLWRAVADLEGLRQSAPLSP